jgi:hypothetical protein
LHGLQLGALMWRQLGTCSIKLTLMHAHLRGTQQHGSATYELIIKDGCHKVDGKRIASDPRRAVMQVWTDTMFCIKLHPLLCAVIDASPGM